MTIAQIYEKAKQQLDKDAITIGEFSKIVDREYQEQQLCEDCISRQAVLEYIEGSEAELGHSSENELVCQDIKKLPSVTPKQTKWIPCSERLPDYDTQVIITVLDDSGDNPYRYTTVGWRFYDAWISDNELVFGKVLAWKPIPEKPYEGE